MGVVGVEWRDVLEAGRWLGDLDCRLAAATSARGYPGLRLTQCLILRGIADERRTVTALTALLGTTKQTVGTQLARLVAEGYVGSSVDRSDGRVRRLELTERGRASLEVLDGVLTALAPLRAAGPSLTRTHVRDGSNGGPVGDDTVKALVRGPD